MRRNEPKTPWHVWAIGLTAGVIYTTFALWLSVQISYRAVYGALGLPLP